MEVFRKAYLASIVPVIVNAVLNEHQVIVDIVAFVSKGDFPRSRLGEKQRGKILASWVTRKMRTIAQFGIRDPDGTDSTITEIASPRRGLGSKPGSIITSSHRPSIVPEHPLSVVQLPQDEQQQAVYGDYIPPPDPEMVQADDYTSPPPALGIPEMSAETFNDDANSIQVSNYDYTSPRLPYLPPEPDSPVDLQPRGGFRVMNASTSSSTLGQSSPPATAQTHTYSSTGSPTIPEPPRTDLDFGLSSLNFQSSDDYHNNNSAYSPLGDHPAFSPTLSTPTGPPAAGALPSHDYFQPEPASSTANARSTQKPPPPPATSPPPAPHHASSSLPKGRESLPSRISMYGGNLAFSGGRLGGLRVANTSTAEEEEEEDEVDEKEEQDAHEDLPREALLYGGYSGRGNRSASDRLSPNAAGNGTVKRGHSIKYDGTGYGDDDED